MQTKIIIALQILAIFGLSGLALANQGEYRIGESTGYGTLCYNASDSFDAGAVEDWHCQAGSNYTLVSSNKIFGFYDNNCLKIEANSNANSNLKVDKSFCQKNLRFILRTDAGYGESPCYRSDENGNTFGAAVDPWFCKLN